MGWAIPPPLPLETKRFTQKSRLIGSKLDLFIDAGPIYRFRAQRKNRPSGMDFRNRYITASQLRGVHFLGDQIPEART